MKKIRVLVVDDSATMRGLIAQTLAREADIDVVGEAADPLEARQAIKTLDPDVVTLDIEMPHMSGLDFLEKIMRLRPTPVIIVSTLTKRGAEETLRALEIGAIDCIEKPRPGNEDAFAELAVRIRIASRARVGTVVPQAAPVARGPATRESPAGVNGARSDQVIAIGASTGGVEALIAVLAEFPKSCPPTVIVQHMPPVFTTTFAQRLDRLCAAEVVEAYSGAKLAPGRIYLAPGGDAHLEIAGGRDMHCLLRKGERVNHHSPSVDVLFQSVARACGPNAVAVLLTGMGRDGAQGMLEMRRAGARTIAQDEHTCVVYGMPKAAVEIGAAARQVPLGAIAREIFGNSAAADGAASRASRKAGSQ